MPTAEILRLRDKAYAFGGNYAKTNFIETRYYQRHADTRLMSNITRERFIALFNSNFNFRSSTINQYEDLMRKLEEEFDMISMEEERVINVLKEDAILGYINKANEIIAVENENLETHWRDMETEEERDQERARERAREESGSEFIRPYEYKPKWIFHGSGPWLGLELEVQAACRAPKIKLPTLAGKLTAALKARKNPDYWQRVEKHGDDGDSEHSEHLEAAAKLATIPDLTFCKHDGSVPNGFEIVSHPVSVTDPWPHLKPFWPVLTQLRQLGFCGTEATGLHIHVSKLQTRLDEVAIIYKNLLYGAPNFWLPVSGRHSAAKLKQYAGFEETQTRYQAVNITEKTVEFRFFQSEIYKDHVEEAIDLVRSIIAFADMAVTEKQRIAATALHQSLFSSYGNIIRPYLTYLRQWGNDYFPYALRLFRRLGVK
jgi:hypothetical protein